MGDIATGATRDLTWVDNAWGQVISNDGKWMVFSTQEPGGTTNYSVFLRKSDGSPAVKLGEGDDIAISPDDKWVVSNLLAAHTIMLLPLGAGESRSIHSDTIEFDSDRGAPFLPDNKRFLSNGHLAGRPARTYMLSVDGEDPKPVTPEGVVYVLLSPDGKTMLTQDSRGQFALTPLDGGNPRPLNSIPPADLPVQWMKDGNTLIIREAGERSVNTYQLDVLTGAKKPWKTFLPKDKVALQGIYQFQITPDGAHYMIVEQHIFSSLFVVSGLK